MDSDFLNYLRLHFQGEEAERLLARLKAWPEAAVPGLQAALPQDAAETERFVRDYEGLFCGTDTSAAVPLWESVYTGAYGRLLDERTAEVAACYLAEGVWITDASEPADSIGHELAFCQLLRERYGEGGPAEAFAAAHALPLLQNIFRLVGQRCRSAYFAVLSDFVLQGSGTGGTSRISSKEYALPSCFRRIRETEAAELLAERTVRAAGRGNCGGKCSLTVTTRAGCVLKTAGGGKPGSVQDALRPCARGMAYPETFLRADRLRTPLLQTGERGSSNFRRITWREAVQLMADKIRGITDLYGPGSRYVNYATGVSAVIRPDRMAKRLLAMDGGFLDYYNSYSTACLKTAVPYMYGTNETGCSPDTLRRARLLILWGFNPVTNFHNPEMFRLLQYHREKKTPVIVIDPQYSDTAAAFATRHVAIRPGTDAALAAAMAWVIWTEKLADEDFLDRHCLGHDSAHMPEGFADAESWKAYIFGQRDGTEKTPAWAAAITGIPAEEIRDLAVLYARSRPAAILTGWGPQRHANGEQTTRAILVLPCMTGNVGLEGGSTGGSIEMPQHRKPSIPVPVNPYGRSIPSFLWTDAILRGTEMTEREDGVRGGRLESNIRLLFNLAGNTLVNQHSDVNRTLRILQDRSKCEFIIDSDLFMTASARYADLILPGTSLLEGEHMAGPWELGNFLLYGNQSIAPLFSSRFEFEWLCELADELGIRGFSEGCRTVREWNGLLYDRIRPAEPELPAFPEFAAAGGYLYRENRSFTAFREQRAHPGEVRYPTESGKIEIFSPALARMALPDVSPIPRYEPAFEGCQDAKREKYPLQLIGWHTKRRCHSIHDNNVRMEKLEPHRLWIHPEDAAARKLREGDMAEIWNDRGRIRMRVHISGRIMKGVVGIPQGAWFTPDPAGTDIRGCVNTLTTARPTPLAKGNPQHSALVEVKRNT